MNPDDYARVVELYHLGTSLSAKAEVEMRPWRQRESAGSVWVPKFRDGSALRVAAEPSLA